MELGVGVEQAEHEPGHGFLAPDPGGAAGRGVQQVTGVGQVLPVLWAARMAQTEPIVTRAVARGQLPAGTSPDDLMKHLTAPLFHRLLVTAEPLTQASADQAAAAALVAARAGVFVPPGHG